MAEIKQILERIYTIPLKEKVRKVPSYKRARKAIVTIKEFIAKHMKVADRDVKKVKVDIHLNNEIWFRGASNAPAKVKVKAIKEGDSVRVTFVEVPEHIKFLQARHERRHKKSEKKAPAEEKKEEAKTEEQKKEETEKEQSAALVKEHVLEQQTKAQKHVTKPKGPAIHRMALKK